MYKKITERECVCVCADFCICKESLLKSIRTVISNYLVENLIAKIKSLLL